MPMSYDKSKERYTAQMLYYVLYYKPNFEACLNKHGLFSDFRVLFLALNARSGIHIPCAL